MPNGIQNTRIEDALSGTGFSDFVRRGAGADTVNRCLDTLSLQSGSGGSRRDRRAEMLTGAACRQTVPHRVRFFRPALSGAVPCNAAVFTVPNPLTRNGPCIRKRPDLVLKGSCTPKEKTMLHESADINHLIQESKPDPDFPDAPMEWTRGDAMNIAREEGLKLTEDHWNVIRALQHYYAQHADDTIINLRELHDALDERFHSQGGVKYLYTLFPGGPIAQSCHIAGLKAPYIATDPSFGSVA
jgi:tRNA 2-thiouridine synthesizing protein E